MLGTASAKPGAAKPRAAKTAGKATAKPAARQTASRRAPAGADLQALIRQRAYELWERDGRPEGRDHAHWQQAEREIGGAHAAR